MKHPTIRLPQIVAVGVAGIAVGLVTTYTVAGGGADESPRSSRPVAQTHVADWAREHQRSGLSPASIGASTRARSSASIDLADALSEISGLAREHRMRGLSPASLEPVGD